MPEKTNEPQTGDTVRLLRAVAGLAAGSEGVFVGWYAGDPRQALVRFWDAGPMRVPADTIAPVSWHLRARDVWRS